MANKLAYDTGNIDSAGIWRLCSGYAGDITTPFKTADYLHLMTSTYTYAFTFSDTGNQTHLICTIKRAQEASGTLTIKLQENVGGSWTDRTTDTYDTTVIPDYNPRFEYIPLTSYRVDTTASKWRYTIVNDTSGGCYIGAGSTSKVTMWVATDAGTTAPSSSDTFIIAPEKTLTINANYTSPASGSLVVMHDALLQWEENPTSSYTFNNRCGIVLDPHNAGYVIGTTENPCPLANRAVLSSSRHIRCNFVSGVIDNLADVDSYISFIGEDPPIMVSKIDGIAEAGQRVITTVDELETTSGAFTIIGKDIPETSSDVATHSITSVVGKTVTATVNLDYDTIDGAYILCTPATSGRLGIYFSGSNVAGSDLFYHVGASPNCVGSVTLKNMYISNCFGSLTANSVTIENCYTVDTTYARNILYLAIYNTPSVTINGIYHYNTIAPVYTTTGDILISNCSNVSVQKLAFKGSKFWGEIEGIDVNFTDCFIVNPNTTTGVAYSPILVGSNHTYTNCTLACSYGISMSLTDSLFDTCTIRDKDIYGIILSSANVDVEFKDCDLDTNPADTCEIYASDFSYTKILFRNCDIPSFNALVDHDTLAGYMRVAFHDYDKTSGDHRNFYKTGNIVATGSGLDDETVHTVGGYAMRFENIDPNRVLSIDEPTPTDNIQDKTMTIAIWCKINSANYYSGTHQLPRLTVNYDNGTTTYAEATETTDWQLLSVSFTPTTDYGQITMTLSTKSDQTGSNSYVYWDDVSILYPAGHTLNLGTINLWAKALPVGPYIATSISSKDVWAASSLEEYGENTMGETLKSAGGGGATPAEIWAYETRKLTGTKQSLDDLNDISTTQVNAEVADATSDIKDKVDDIDQTTKDNQALILS